MSIENPNVVHALAVVTASAFGAAVVPTFAANRGFRSEFAEGSTHTALGVYNFGLDEDLDANEGVVMAIPVVAPGVVASCTVTETDDHVKTVNTYLAGAPSDAVGFKLAVLRLPA